MPELVSWIGIIEARPPPAKMVRLGGPQTPIAAKSQVVTKGCPARDGSEHGLGATPMLAGTTECVGPAKAVMRESCLIMDDNKMSKDAYHHMAVGVHYGGWGFMNGV